MAEFQEVMRQAKRMCDDSNGVDVRKGFATLIDDSEDFVRMFEELVMDWAEKNPEPRCPTWEEWWNEKFPGMVARGIYVSPCTYGVEGPETCDGGCGLCRKNEIPADIAEKLGIKPMGGTEDA